MWLKAIERRRRIFRRRFSAFRPAAQNAVWIAAGVFFGALLASPSHAEELAGDPLRGAARSKAEQCQECHGATGLGTAEHYPKLAGQWSSYIRKQLRDFQSGARKNEIMTAMAADLSPQDVADIAAYFSSARPWGAQPDEFSKAGEQLYLQGQISRGVPACASCHGALGAGLDAIGAPVPVLAGQNRSYLANQLFFWKVGDRSNSGEGVMNAVAHSLTADDIDALAKYLSGLRARNEKAD